MHPKKQPISFTGLPPRLLPAVVAGDEMVSSEQAVLNASRHREYICRRGMAKPRSAVFMKGEEDSSDQSELSLCLQPTLHPPAQHRLLIQHTPLLPLFPRIAVAPSLRDKMNGAQTHGQQGKEKEREKDKEKGKRKASRRTPSSGSAKTHARVLSLDSSTTACLNDPHHLGAPASSRPLTTSKSDLEAKEGEVLDAASLLGRASQLESVTRSRNSLPCPISLSHTQDATTGSRGEHTVMWVCTCTYSLRAGRWIKAINNSVIICSPSCPIQTCIVASMNRKKDKFIRMFTLLFFIHLKRMVTWGLSKSKNDKKLYKIPKP